MSNPLDAFDNDPPALGGWSPASPSQASQSATPSGPNPLDAYDNDPSVFGAPPINAQSIEGEQNASLGSTAKQAGYGVLAAIPDTVASLADLAEKGTYDNVLLHDPVTGESQITQLGRALGLNNSPVPAPHPYQPASGAALKSGLGMLGLNPDNLPQPLNAPERIARTVGEVGASVLAPELAIGRLGLLGQGAKAALEPMIGTGTTGSMATNTAKAAAAGLGSGVAQEAVPDKYKPVAGLVGGLAGGALGEAPEMAWAGLKKGASLVPPMSDAGVQKAAGRKLYGAAEDPQAAISTIGNTANPELVPGSQPTAGQLTGDLGLLNLERTVSRQAPDDFIARRAEQNAARLDALNNIQANGDPADVGAFFRNQLDDINSRTQAALDQATSSAQQAVGRLGGTQAPDVTGAQMRGLLDRATPRLTGGDQPLAVTGAQMRGLLDRMAPRMTGGEQAADLTGQQIRGALENSIAQMEAREQSLWDAIPKDVAVVSSPLKASIANVYGDMPNIMKTTLSAPEKNIVNEISSYPAQIPIQDLNALRTVVNNEIRTARSPMQPNYLAYGRLSQVRGAIDDAIEASVTGRAAAEQRAVAAGEMAPEDTMAAKWEQAKRDEFRGWDADSDAEAVGSAGPRSLGNSRGQATPVSDAHGAEGQTGGGFNNPPSNPGMASTAGNRPLLDQAGADALKAATAATKEKKTLTQAQPIAGILQRPYETSPYNVADASVPGRIWKKGLDSSATVTRYLDATKSSPEAVAALREAAAQSLRSEAAVNGFLSEQGFRAWRQKYAGPLQRLEQASPGFTQSLETSASNVGPNVRGILSKMDISNAAVPSMIWQKGPAGAQAVRDLLTLSKNDPAAIAAVKEAATQSLRSEALENGFLSRKAFDDWKTKYAEPLRQLEAASPGTIGDFAKAASNAGEDVTGILAKRNVIDTAVPGMIWKPKAAGAASARDFLNVTKGDPRAAEMLKEAASNSLLREADGGILTDEKFASWRNRYSEALSELEKVAPGTTADYADAASASRAIERAKKDQKQQEAAYKAGAIGKILKTDNAADTVDKVGSILTREYAVANMKRLAQEASKNPDALDGLRRAVADNLQGLIGNTEAGTSGLKAIKADRFQNYIRNNGAALAQVLNPDEMNVLNAIGADMQRALRTERATKVGEGSDTWQNKKGEAKHGSGGGGGSEGSILTTLLGGGLGLAGGHGIIGTAMGHVVGALRKAGFERVDDVVKEALLNPELARTLLMKVPASKGAGIPIANRIMRATAIGAVPTQQNREQSNRKP